MSNRERNYTMIDELEDISDMPQQQQDIIPNDISEKIKGKIRHNYAAPQAAGMGSFNYQNIPKQQHPLYPQQPPPPPQRPPPRPPPPPPARCGRWRGGGGEGGRAGRGRCDGTRPPGDWRRRAVDARRGAPVEPLALPGAADAAAVDDDDDDDDG